MAKAETVETEVVKTVTEEHVMLTLSFEEASVLMEYVAGGRSEPTENIWRALDEYAKTTGKIPAFMHYPAKKYGWVVSGSPGSRYVTRRTEANG